MVLLNKDLIATVSIVWEEYSVLIAMDLCREGNDRQRNSRVHTMVLVTAVDLLCCPPIVEIATSRQTKPHGLQCIPVAIHLRDQTSVVERSSLPYKSPNVRPQQGLVKHRQPERICNIEVLHGVVRICLVSVSVPFYFVASAASTSASVAKRLHPAMPL